MTVAELRKAIAERHPKTKRGKERKAKAAPMPTSFEVSNVTEAKTSATQLSNWLTANEDKVASSSPLMDVLKHISQLYRRINDKGRKR